MVFTAKSTLCNLSSAGSQIWSEMLAAKFNYHRRLKDPSF